MSNIDVWTPQTSGQHNESETPRGIHCRCPWDKSKTLTLPEIKKLPKEPLEEILSHAESVVASLEAGMADGYTENRGMAYRLKMHRIIAHHCHKRLWKLRNGQREYVIPNSVNLGKTGYGYDHIKTVDELVMLYSKSHAVEKAVIAHEVCKRLIKEVNSAAT